MVYSTFADCSKKIAHWSIDATFPSSPTIATISGAAGWYGYQVGVTFAPNIINTWICNQIGYAKGLATAPLITPSLTPYIATYISIGASCATSLTLNLLSHGFFRLYSSWEKAPAGEAPAPAPAPAKKEAPPVVEEVNAAPAVLVQPHPIAHELETRLKELQVKELPVPRKKAVKPAVKSDCCWNLCSKPAIKTKKSQCH